MKIVLLLLPMMMALALTGCGTPMGLAAVSGGGMYSTKPDDLSPADTADQIPPHESWCYSTMGMQVECYSEPQDTPANRLVNVDPPNRYPLTTQAYADALTQSKAADAAALNAKLAARPPATETAIVVVPPPVQPADVMSAPLPEAKAAPVKPHKPVKHKKKKKKLPPKAPPAALPNPVLPPSEPINP